MPRATTVFQIDNPHLTVRLYEDLLKIDLKGSLKNEIEEALENRPVLKETVGSIFSIFVPLHIRVSEISSVDMNDRGRVKVSLRHHRDIVIPIERKENAQKLVEKLNQAILEVRAAKIREHLKTRRAEKRLKRRSKGLRPSSYGTVPYYFPTEEADIVDKLNRKKMNKRSGELR